jgi:hypothetical protein
MIRKYWGVALVLLFILFFPECSAVRVEMKKDFSQGETLIAKLSGYFLEPILRENIIFYRNHIRIPMESDVARIGENYFIYANLLGKGPNNYSLVIRDVRHMDFTETTDEDIVKNFSITSNWADFSVNPGFISSDDDFFIEARNLRDEEIILNIKIISSGDKNTTQDSMTVSPQSIKKIKFPLLAFDNGVNNIELSSGGLIYEIPVAAYLHAQEQQQKEKREFKFEPSFLNISVSTNSTANRTIYLYNTGQTLLENISVSASNILKPYVNLSMKEIKSLKNGTGMTIRLYVLPFNKEQNLQGHIKAKTRDGTLITYSEISLSFVEGYVPSPEEQQAPPSSLTCSEHKGIICTSDKTCEGERITAKDGNCCLGICSSKEPEGQKGRTIGVIILAVIVAALIFFYIKFKKAKKPVNLLKVAKGK